MWVEAIQNGLASNTLDLRLQDDQQKRPLILSFYDIVVPCGAMCSCALVDKAPEVDFSGATAATAAAKSISASEAEDETRELYTVLMIDCDAIVPETLHWLVVDVEDRQMKTGRVIHKYQPPKPLFGEHRYMVMVMQQRLEKSILVQSPSSYAFDCTAFAKEHGLEPVAVNWVSIVK